MHKYILVHYLNMGKTFAVFVLGVIVVIGLVLYLNPQTFSGLAVTSGTPTVQATPVPTAAPMSDQTIQTDKEIIGEAVTQDSVAKCREVSDENRDYCYYNLAIKEGQEDYTVCAYIEFTTMRDACYITVAQLTGNEQICELVSRTKRSAC